VIALPAFAWAQVAVQVTPLRVELKAAAPGGSYTQVVTVSNQGKDPIRVHARVDDWFLSKDGTPQFAQDVKAAAGVPTATMAAYSASAWLRVNPAEQVVKAGAEAIVRFTVSVPATTREGGYRAAIMFEPGPVDADPAGPARSVQFRGRFATLVYVTVGTVKAVVDLVDIQPYQKPGQPVGVVATLKNSGRVQVRTKGQLVVYDKAGVVVRRVVVPDVPVLPESERDLTVPLAEEGQPPLPAGEYRLELRIDVGLAEVLVGETTLTIGPGR
jgi:hypothetical protein